MNTTTLDPPPTLATPTKLPGSTVAGRPDLREEERLVTDLSVALHRGGAPSYDLEDFVTAYAERIGCRVEVFCTPTSIFLSFDDGDHTKTTMVRLNPGEIDLRKLAEVYRVADEACGAGLSSVEVRSRLDAIRGGGERHPVWASILAFAIATGTAAGFFGGGWRDLICATIIGVVVGVVGLAMARGPRLRKLSQPLCAAIASALAVAGAHAFTLVSPEIVTLSSLIVLIPGLSLTTAVSELAQDHLSAGTARFMGAITQLLTLALGVATGRALVATFVEIPMNQPIPLPAAGVWGCVFVAALSFVVLFLASWRDAPRIVLTCAAVFAAVWWGREPFGPELGAAFAAFTLGVMSNALSRLSGRPAQVTLVPALLILVPGSLGFQAVQAFLERQTVEAVQSAFGALFIAAALVSGLLVANAVVRPMSLRFEPTATQSIEGQ